MSDPNLHAESSLHPPKKAPKPMMKVFPDGREVLDLKTRAGADEYQRRKLEMWDRQGKTVCAPDNRHLQATSGPLAEE